MKHLLIIVSFMAAFLAEAAVAPNGSANKIDPNHCSEKWKKWESLKNNYPKYPSILSSQQQEHMPPSPIPIACRDRIKTGYVHIGSGALYYEELGEGQPLLLIHERDLDRRMWDDQFTVLAQFYRVIRYDARNHGFSQCKADSFCHSSDLCCLMRHLNIDKAIIMGHSMGGNMAIDFALTNPNHVAALVVVSPDLNEYTFDVPGTGKARSVEEAVEYKLRVWADGPYRTPYQLDPIVRDKIREMYLSTFRNRVPGSLEIRPNPLIMFSLEKIHVPTLIIVGSQDVPSVLEMSQMIAREVPGAQRTVISNSAHLLNMENPGEFNRRVLDFLTKNLPMRLDQPIMGYRLATPLIVPTAGGDI